MGALKVFSSFYPSEIDRSPYQPSIVFTELMVENRVVDFTDDQPYLTKPINEVTQLNFAHTDKGNFNQIRCTGLYQSGQKTNFNISLKNLMRTGKILEIRERSLSQI